jgi:hypothetical protein
MLFPYYFIDIKFSLILFLTTNLQKNKQICCKAIVYFTKITLFGKISEKSMHINKKLNNFAGEFCIFLKDDN